MKLEFSGLNGLLHTALSYLCQDDCVIPDAPPLPEGTAVRLELVWPEGDQPLVVNGNSLGLDPGGRGLRLEIHDPAALHQVVMIMAHLHFGPYVGKRLLERFGISSVPQSPASPTETMHAALPVTQLPDAVATELIKPAHAERTQLPAPSRDGQSGEWPAGEAPTVRPPRLRPPVIRPPRIRPPAAATELPRFSKAEPDTELSHTAIAINPELIAQLDDLDDDY